MKPNLFIVGAPKCGTSAWRNYLRAHPDIFFAPLKEPQYFATDLPQVRGIRTAVEYEELFADAGTARIIAEASSRYLFSREAAANIHAFNPHAKILIFLREQEHYLPSLHNHLLFAGDETIGDFEQAWGLSEQRGPSDIAPHCREPWMLNYKAAGRFCEQVERYFAVFPADQIRVIHFRDWTCNPRQTYLDLLGFLHLPDDGRTEFPRVNEAMNARSRWLARMMAEQPLPVKALANLVKRSLGQRRSWRLSKRISALNARKGYSTRLGDRIREEIRAFYASDNASLEPRIWKHSAAPGECTIP